MCAYLGSGPRKIEHNVSCFFMKRYVSLVCNEFVARDYTVFYLVSKLALAGIVVVIGIDIDMKYI